MFNRLLAPPDDIRAFEFEDFPWYPNFLRNMMTDLLAEFIRMGVYGPQVIEKVKIMIEQLDNYEITDLCAGSGEPAMYLRNQLQQQVRYPIRLRLTDKYPNKDRFRMLQQGYAHTIGEQQSVDAMHLPPHIQGIRTLFASFHHFNKAQAKQILQDAIDNETPIGVFEFTERTWLRVFFMLIGFVHILAITPFIKPFTLERFIFTYVIPIVPLVYFWDGLISNLRTYTVAELNQMTQELQNVDQMVWDIGQIPSLWPIKITYLTAYPRPKLTPAEQDRYYQALCEHTSADHFDAAAATAIITRKPLRFNHLYVEKKLQEGVIPADVIVNIIKNAPDDQTAIDLLKLIHAKDPTIDKSCIKHAISDIPLMTLAQERQHSDSSLSQYLMSLKIEARTTRATPTTSTIYRVGAEQFLFGSAPSQASQHARADQDEPTPIHRIAPTPKRKAYS